MRIVMLLRRGPRQVARRVRLALFQHPRCWKEVRRHIRGDGIEIGGPSQIFETLLPVYGRIRSADNYTFKSRPGFKYANEFKSDGPRLDRQDASCDFVLSSHVLEHIANPILALKEWLRVLRPGGYLLMVLPEGRSTWDNKRPTTTLEHLVVDFQRGVGEDDRTHIEEVITLTNRKHWSFPANSPHDWDAIYRANVEQRGVHHHVFDRELAPAALRYAGFDVLASEVFYPFHIVVFAQKPH